VRYVLIESATGKVILDEQVRAEHTATGGDAFYGPDRLRLANEGSARKNITALVAKLNALRPSRSLCRCTRIPHRSSHELQLSGRRPQGQRVAAALRLRTGCRASPLSSIATNFAILAARVSGFLAVCTR
jgi:hypothetical protein